MKGDEAIGMYAETSVKCLFPVWDARDTHIRMCKDEFTKSVVERVAVHTIAG